MIISFKYKWRSPGACHSATNQAKGADVFRRAWESENSGSSDSELQITSVAMFTIERVPKALDTYTAISCLRSVVESIDMLHARGALCWISLGLDLVLTQL